MQAQTSDIVDAVADTAAISGDREKAFTKARRHSRLVRVLKVVLPSLAVIMAAVFFGYSYVLTPAIGSVDVDGAVFADGKLVMANPKLNGFTKDNLPYSMTAVRAIQDLKNESVIELDKIDARLPVDEKNWATIAAAKGLYDRGNNTIELTENISVKTTDGMVAQFKSAFIDMDKGDLRSDEPVDIRREGTHISSDSLRISQNGKVLVFEKRVRMNLDPGAMKSIKQADGGTDAGQ
jgi:lipopolysaccharide export system protein LptC